MRTNNPPRGVALMPSAVERGAAIKKRRLALRIPSLNQFEKASGITRGTLAKAEDGTASEQKLDEIEAWLDAYEIENDPMAGHSHPDAVRVSMHGVYGVGDLDLIFEGGADPDEVALYVGRIIEELKKRT
jgi:transcriptional regulator with XRE-family HTH domain